ncbi:unnamed protein product [Cylindrotheca closterium]|uniref:RNA-binding S4 domain-containing protein n=1 Tax=Cylindrotheca closterium TaxID=2856 RepID=A0AAD2CUK5_9STRA|nr:unnamed protein product [Cylindrotheca closterium]
MSFIARVFICFSAVVAYASGFTLSTSLSVSSIRHHAAPLNAEAAHEPIRLNKVFKKTHSRRQADQLIADGRITVNGEPSHSAGQRVVPFEDVVCLDGNVVEGWEAMNHLQVPQNGERGPKETSQNGERKREDAGGALDAFEYIKYWKPLGVTCTTDRRIDNNLIDALGDDGYHPKTRVFPVGRLDKETSGLLLMTSDGRLPNSALRGRFKQPKTYLVRTNRPVEPDDVQQLREGVIITTLAQRDGNRAKPLTAPTLPCPVRQNKRDPHVLEITLVEGRNRQIRKMMEAVGYHVFALHRKGFLQMNLDNLEGPGDWAKLSNDEMKIIEEVLAAAEEDDGDF